MKLHFLKKNRFEQYNVIVCSESSTGITWKIMNIQFYVEQMSRAVGCSCMAASERIKVDGVIIFMEIVVFI